MNCGSGVSQIRPTRFKREEIFYKFFSLHCKKIQSLRNKEQHFQINITKFTNKIMRYFGGKFKLAKEILEVVLKDARPGQVYVEPFVGGCSVVPHVTNRRRIAGDLNRYVICFLKAIQSGWIPPDNITEEQYDKILSHRRSSKYNKYLDVNPENSFTKYMILWLRVNATR